MNKYNKAFTLAEVLITLGIIGIVAALTLPSLIQKQNEKATVSQLKKFYSSLQQAYVSLSAEYGPASEWTAETPLQVADLFSEKMKITKKCAPKAEGCWYNEYTLNKEGTPSENLLSSDTYSSAILSDGSLLVFGAYSSTCNQLQSDACTQVIIDTNGYKKPNQWGRDVFAFLVLKDRVVPRGWVYGKGSGSFQNMCLTRGHSCAAWVIVNENMDYLHCNDLSWEGKTKCK